MKRCASTTTGVKVRRSRLLITLGLSGGVAASAAAQDAPARAQLDSLRTRLSAATTVAQVDDIRRSWASNSRGELRKVGEGFALLGRNVLLDSAAVPYEPWALFDQLVRSHPSWPYARLGLAMAALSLYQHRAVIPADYETRAGGSHYDGYVIQLKRLLDLEPGFPPALEWLAATMAGELDREQPSQAIRLLEYLLDSAGSRNADAALVLARDARTHGHLQLALARLSTFQHMGGDEGVLALERARTLAAMGNLAGGAASYLDGARELSPVGREAYRLDLEWVARGHELARFDSVPADSLATFMTAFWLRRDAQELRQPGERLAEHLRRWVFVHQHFRVPDPARRTAYARVFISNIRGSVEATACQEDGNNSLDDLDYLEPARAGRYRQRERVLDHRAIVYMRHGEPYLAIGGLSYASMPELTRLRPGSLYATWVYFIEGIPRFFNFEPNGALGSDQPGTLVLNGIPNLDAMLRLASVSPEYARLSGLLQFYQMSGTAIRPIPVNCQAPVREAIREQREGAEVALRTDTYLRRMTTELDASVQLYTMGQPEAGTGQLVIAAAVSARDLEPVVSDATTDRYTLRIEAAAIDSATGNAVRRDTTIVFAVDRRARRDGWLAGLLVMPLEPGQREVRVAVTQGDTSRGAILGGRIAPASGDGLALSDIVLGRESTSLRWLRDGESVGVSPSATFKAGAGIDLYYELYGLDPARTYRTELSLTQVNRTRASSSLSFTDKATGTRMGFARRLVLGELEGASYQLKVVVVEAETGASTERTRTIVVIEP